MRKSLISALVLSTSLFITGCQSSTNETQANNATQTNTPNTNTNINSNQTVNDEKIKIVTTSFSEYDWVTNIVGEHLENFDIALLVNSGVDLHSYEPSVDDFMSISYADLFIHNGGSTDTWALNVAEQTQNSDLTTISLTELLTNDLIITEHDHDEDEHDHDHDEDEHDHSHDEDEHDHSHDEDEHDHDEDEHDHDHDEEECDDPDCDHDHSHDEFDEHVWLSLENAIVLCNILAEEISNLDPTNASDYATNVANYTDSLAQLSQAYQTAVSESPRDTLIFADRFPFIYLTSDYGINYHSAFSGCSAETEASFETILNLTTQTNALDVNYVLIIDNGLEDLANTIIADSNNTEREILVLDSIQSVTQQMIDSGVSYYSIMESNLEVLKLALAK